MMQPAKTDSVNIEVNLLLLDTNRIDKVIVLRKEKIVQAGRVNRTQAFVYRILPDGRKNSWS
jgi:hypothetical protein